MLIIGASSGICAATARRLPAGGYRVVGGVRRPDSVTSVPGIEWVQMNAQDEESVVAAVRVVLERTDRIDILINNAGVSLVGPVEATSVAKAGTLFDVNVFGVLRVVRAVLPSMRSRRGGLVVNISSVLGFLPAPLWGFTRAASTRLRASLSRATTR